MSITIRSNIASLQAQRKLAESSDALSTIFERLSSGMRINRASDDAAGLAIASSLNADSRVFGQAMRNINDGLSVLGIAEGALTELSNISIRQRELATQAANGTYTLQQRCALNTEANALVDEFNRIIGVTEFNGMKLLDHSIGELRIQAGYGLASSIGFRLGDELARTVGDGTFQTRMLNTTGDAPMGLVAGDFNSDGRLDLISADENSATSSLFIGNGNGTFAARSSLNVYRCLAVKTADFNNDGKLDLLMSHSTINPGTIVMLGNGDGTFGASSSINSNVGLPLGLADFNSDGFVDVVSSNTQSNYEIMVNLSNGNGTFKAATSYDVFGIVPTAITTGDLNGDNKDDLVVGTAAGSSPVIMFLSNGDGTFSAAVSFTVSGDQCVAAINDINGDGINDIAVGSTGTGRLLTYIGKGDGTFTRYTYTSTFNTPIGFMLAKDINGDGVIDLLTNERNQNCVDVLIGNGNGTFQARNTIPAGGRPYGLVLGDFSGDGVDDLATADYLDDTMSIFIGNGRKITTISYFNLKTQQGARDAMSAIDDTLSRIAAELGAIGSTESRLGVAFNTLAATRENYMAAASRITDADIAQESANLVRQKILQQSCAAVLAQANQQPALALKLLQ